MNNFVFKSSTEFVFGKNTEQQVGELAAKYGAQEVMIVSGCGSAAHSGLLCRVQESLSSQRINHISFEGVQPNPIDSKVYEGIEKARLNKIDFLIAIGGGSVIDTAKAIAAGANYTGDFWDFWAGRATLTEALPIGVVLTIPASGSEASGNSVITKTKGLHKISLRTGDVLRPVFSVMNPELTFTLSPWQTACGIADMMSHIMERYFTNTTDNEITDRLCEGLLKGIITETPKVINAPKDYEARANIMWAGTMAHNGLCGVGREEDWASHDLEHEISALYNVTHGAGLAVIQPAWMTWITGSHPEKVAQFAERVWNIEKKKNIRLMALQGVQCLKNFYKSIQLPTTFQELGIENPNINLLVTTLHENKGKTVGHYIPLDSKATREIYKLAI